MAMVHGYGCNCSGQTNQVGIYLKCWSDFISAGCFCISCCYRCEQRLLLAADLIKKIKSNKCSELNDISLFILAYFIIDFY